MDVDRGAPGDRHEPRGQVPAVVDRPGGSPRLHERLLRGLLCQAPIAERPHGYRVHEAAVLAVDRPHRLGVTIAKPTPRGPIHHGSGRYTAGAGQGAGGGAGTPGCPARCLPSGTVSETLPIDVGPETRHFGLDEARGGGQTFDLALR